MFVKYTSANMPSCKFNEKKKKNVSFFTSGDFLYSVNINQSTLFETQRSI